MAETRARSSSLSSLDPTEFKFPQGLVPERENLPAGRVTTTTLDGTLTKTPLKLIEDLTNGCGGQLWPAGVRLAKYFINRYRDNNDLAGKRVVELGSGGGVTGLAIGLELDQIGGGDEKGGCDFWMTDMSAMMELMEKNVAFNDLGGRIQCGLLDWADPLPTFVTSKPVDILLAADCVYFEPAFPLLEKTLCDIAGPDTEVLFCFKKRRRADMRFIKAIRRHFTIAEIKEEGYEGYSRESIFLYTMKKKQP
ncbi:hypothetical protein H072_10856 [Dactylellina haptotyla CBS 200.50]|uniref:Protein-lysine N-methyltransferase EFM6 n=1 Tax=Dactylellina haptotyla (strain CBS 200.50) TaxID=1284197 RepID=S8B9D4_DACHA|nr:hypothetical protein H072_10856 [Dactylellina haptotyla CBS 200.50]